MKFKVLFFALMSCATAQAQSADSAKVIYRSHMVGIGGTDVLDTYLSEEHFRGWGVSFLSTVERKRPGRRWSTLVEHEANLSVASDRANTHREMEGAYNFYWGRLRGWKFFNERLTLQAGAVGTASLGFIYHASNGNNPAQGRFHLNVMPTAVAAYRFKLFRKPCMARYEINLPLAGVMFSPNYGQSYYEIFSRGNYDHNIVFTTFVSAPEWRQMLTLDAALSRSFTLRIGYLGNIQQSKVNNLRQHIWTHRFLIGITKQFSVVRR
jgi:hypothetical protein